MGAYLLLSFALITIATYAYYNFRTKKPATELPHPEQPPLLDRLFVEPSPPQVETWARQIPHDGFLQYYGILGQKRILVSDLSAIHSIFQTHNYDYVKPPAISKILKSILGEGLVVAEGEQHRSQRKVLQPAFKLRSVKDLYPFFWTKTAELVEMLRASASIGTPIDILDLSNRVTLDIIANSGFGLDVNRLAKPDNAFYTNYMKGFMPSSHAQFYRMLALILPEWMLDELPLKRNQELRTAIKAVKDAIEQKLDLGQDSSDRKDIITLLRTESGVENSQMLLHQSLTLLGAGHDTVAQALNWSFYELCQNPDVQNRLRSEINQSLPQISTIHHTPDARTLESISTLPYLNAFCNEILRLHPPIPHLHRTALLGAHDLPKGSHFIISISAMNKSPLLWSGDPDKFDPNRWINDATGGAKEGRAFLSFSQGARSCIGERFARAEMAFILAGVVGSFEMAFAEGRRRDVELEYGITARFEGELLVRMKPVGTD